MSKLLQCENNPRLLKCVEPFSRDDLHIGDFNFYIIAMAALERHGKTVVLISGNTVKVANEGCVTIISIRYIHI